MNATRLLRLSVCLVSVVAGLATTATVPAQAAPPPNDSITTPTAVTAIPSTFTQDTSRATSDPADGRCVLGRSVWYRYRPTTTRVLRVSTLGSDYDTFLAVFEGTRVGNRTLIACNDDRVGLASVVRAQFVAGKKYWIAVSSCCSRTARGGQAVVSFYTPAPPGVAATVDLIESGGVSGRLFASGTLQCDTLSGGYVYVVASQRVGDAVARGEGWAQVIPCTSTPAPYRVEIDSSTGWAFQPGTVALTLYAESWDGFKSAETTLSVNGGVVDNPNTLAPTDRWKAEKRR